MTRKTVSDFLNGRVGVSATMALRLGMATNTTPESGLRKQLAYDLWQTKKKLRKLKVTPLAA